jgi:alcohol dehydrogenase class IV
MTDMYCVEGIRRAATALPRAWENGRDREARAGMAWASLLGGLSLANAGLGAVHGFAAPVGGRFSAPHGAICAAVLPHAMEINLEALRRRAPQNPAVERYGEIARLLTGQLGATAEDGIRWVGELCRKLQIPGLRAYGVTDAHISELVQDAARTSSMKGNPIPLKEEELREIVTRAI